MVNIINLLTGSGKLKTIKFNSKEEYDFFKKELYKTIKFKQLEIILSVKPEITKLEYQTIMGFVTEETFFERYFDEILSYVFKRIKKEDEEINCVSLYTRELLKSINKDHN